MGIIFSQFVFSYISYLQISIPELVDSINLQAAGCVIYSPADHSHQQCRAAQQKHLGLFGRN
jgi:hypothetical protein